MSDETPQFVEGNPLLEDAYAVAYEGHQRRRKRDGDDITHPLAVAELLHERGFDDPVVAAALLHDVVEDTTIDLPEISSRFGEEICTLVDEMTEKEGIEPYGERKAEHRSRVARDPRAAAVYAADKLARTRQLTAEGTTPEPERFLHYLQTLRTLRETNPGLPFLPELEQELDEIVRDQAAH